MELGLILFTLIEIAAALAIYHHRAIRRQIHARIGRALKTGVFTVGNYRRAK
jgi:hypothetical protein